MAGNTESQYGAAGTEGSAAAAGGGAYAPPIMHSWCLQPDGPREQVSMANDADDDCGFDLNLGLSLGGAPKSSSSKPKSKEKEVVLDRDAFREKEKEAASEEPAAAAARAPQGGVMFKPLKSEQQGGGGGNNPRVQAFWQDLDRSGNEKQAVEVASSNWAGVNSVAEDSKMFAQHMWQALQGKAAQAEHQRVPLSARDEASLIKELQGLPPQAVATAAAWARVVAQDGFPVQLLEAIRDGVESQGSLQRSKSVASEPALSAGGPSNNNNDLERSDSDVSKNMQHAAIIQQQELEQQRKREQTQKRQEARRKRKALLEGQKSKKTSKKEESGSMDSNPNQLRRTSSLQQQQQQQPSKENSVTAASSPPDSQDASSMSAFRRPTGSSAWLHNWEGTKGGDPEKPPQDSVDIRRTLERARAKDGGDSNNAQVDSSSESRKVGSPDVGQLQRMDLDRTRTEGGPPMAAQIDPSWIQRIMEVQRNNHQQGTATMENHGAKTNFPGRSEKQPLPKSEKVAKRGRGASESSSGGTESSGGGHDERSGRDGEALSSLASSAAAAAENARPNSSAAMPAVAMANMTFPPGPGGFPMVPGHPFPFPLPMPPGGGAPFNMPFPFPYVMQFAPGPVGDGNNNNNNNNPDQQQQQQRPFQIALPPGFNPQFQIQTPDGAPTWASAVVRPHAATPPHSPPRNGTGTKTDEKRGVKATRNAPEPSSQSSLVKANSMGSGAFNRLRSASVAPVANGSPLAPQFGISRSKSDAVALRREGSVGSAFAALGELPFPAPKTSAPAAGAAAAAPVAEDREQNANTPASEETSRRPPSQQQPTGVWRQGSVPSFEGIGGHEASSLRPGVAPGVQFGGTGSPPDLPWVTCNGTISGVLYRVEKGQVRIVCACHGRHMTPAEFVQHAGCGEIPNPEKAIVVGPFAVLPQQPASAQA